jgi:hypothetical protein
MWKMRLFAFVIILVSAGLIYVNWQQVLRESTYSLQIAAFGPLGVVGGLFLLLFPQNAGKPETTMQKVIAFLVFAVGITAGVYNWYLMDPGFFGM